MISKKNHLPQWLLTALLAAVVILPAKAQNNVYDIDDSLYVIYERANKFRYKPEELAIADTLYMKAVEKGDKKAQCLARTIPVAHYSNADDEKKLEQAVDECKQMARKNNYLQYYYYAVSSQITWFLNQGRQLHAMQLAKDMQDQAMEDNNDYGIIQSYRMQGNIYTVRHWKDEAIKRYSQALEYMLSHNSGQDPTSLYERLATCYAGKGDYKRALQYTEEGIKSAKTYGTRMSIMMEKCRLLFLLGQTQEFRKLYAECLREINEKGTVQRNRLLELEIYDLLTREDFAKAQHLADSISNTNDNYKLKEYIARASGDYRKAYDYACLQEVYRDSVMQEMLTSDVAELSMSLDYERLKHQYERQEAARRYTYIISALLFLILVLILIGLLRLKRTNRMLRRQKEELAVAREIAESSNQMKDAFIHNMSHEIRTPLNAIVGISQIIATPDIPISDEEKLEYQNIIQSNAELLTTLVSDILDLAALESGKYSLKIAPFCCNELCRIEIASVRHRCPPNVNLYFTTDVPDDFQTESDEKRIRQVLTNFLGNALKHTEQGEIRLHASLTQNPGNLTFSVTDTGPGIPADKMPVIFDRFVKLNTGKPGTGLGLNICRVIADLLGGSVSLDQNYTGGSRFFFVIPLDGKA